MGKKSKKNAGSRAKAKAGGSSSAAAGAAPSALSAAAPSATAATLTTTGTFDARNGFESNNGGVLAIGGNVGSKKLKCIRCCCALKDLAKAHQCPGCAQLYCWRCEKKKFRECLNGKNCVKPLRRCTDCTGGRTMARLSNKVPSLRKNGDIVFAESFYHEAVDLIGKDERLSMAAIPFRHCVSSECLWDKPVVDQQGFRWGRPCECNACASITDSSRPSYFRKCSQCVLVVCTMCDDDTKERLRTIVRNFGDVPSADLASLRLETLTSKFPRAVLKCRECQRDICANCNTKGTRGTSFVIDRNGFQTICPPCTEKKYWSTKPCTNPTCPNEVGVPTKRCGGCHIDRYCSVECQGMAYPAHRARCQAILAKRAAAAGK